MKSRSNRPGRDAECFGDLVERHVEVVVQDHHRTMVDGETPKASLELIAMSDQVEPIGRNRFVNRQQPKVGAPAVCLPALGVAGAHEESIRPGVEARRVAELRKVLPDVQQRLLRRVLGEVGVAQNPVSHRMEPVSEGHSKARECPFVAVLRAYHKTGVHATSARERRLGPAHSSSTGAPVLNPTQSSGRGQGAGMEDAEGCRHRSINSTAREEPT